MQTARLDHAHHDLKTVGDKLAVSQSDVSRLSGELNDQNHAIDAMAADAKRRDQAAQKAVSAAQLKARKAQAKEAAILAAMPGPDACASADALILEGVRP